MSDIVKQVSGSIGWRARLKKIKDIIKAVNIIWDMEITQVGDVASINRGPGKITIIIPDIDEKLREHVAKHHQS